VNKDLANKILLGRAEDWLPEVENDSIDLVLTDPPYFLDRMDDSWDHKEVSLITDYCYTVQSLPPGMRFDREQGKRFYDWYLVISKEIYRVLKPGGFFFSFSSPRLYHRMASAIDDAGFMLRDCFIWLYTQSQPKAMSLNHFIDRMCDDINVKRKLKEELAGWKTPQVKSCFEPIAVAQKQYEGTLLENMRKYKVGLVNTNVRIGKDMFPANVTTAEEISPTIQRYFLVPKPNRDEKGEYNIHRTVKPLAICEYIIQLVTFDTDAIVLDPFVGSGTTAVAAKSLGRRFIGIDSNREYVEIAQRRLAGKEAQEKHVLPRQAALL